MKRVGDAGRKGQDFDQPAKILAGLSLMSAQCGVCRVWCVQSVVCAECGVCRVWCVQSVVCAQNDVCMCLKTLHSGMKT